MPELPEVEAVIGMLRPTAIGATIVRADVFRARSIQPQDKAALVSTHGKRIESIERRGKNILIGLSGAMAVRVHLRMTGMLKLIPDARLYTSSTRVLFTLKDRRGIAFEDRRVLGTVHVHSKAELEKKLSLLGPEPLARAFTTKYLIERAGRSNRAIKVFLMDQSNVAGLGNIYAAEALFAAGIHPAKPANSLGAEELRNLHTGIRKVLRQGVRNAAKTYRQPDRHEGMAYRVYGRRGEPCLVCAKNIVTMEQGARTTFYCAKCQRK